MIQRAAENLLLASLPRASLAPLLAHLQEMPLEFGDIIYRPGDLIRHVYFPLNCLVSLLTLVEGHLALEVGLVGREGMLGVPVALGVVDSPVRALVQGSGASLRIGIVPFMKEFRRNAPLQRAVNRYTYDLMVQVTQTAACNRFHQVEARLARWLLMTRDRVRSDHFKLTQEMLAGMLGVLRVAVTKAAGILEKRKLISYSRGDIHILDANALEESACLCYQVVKLDPRSWEKEEARSGIAATGLGTTTSGVHQGGSARQGVNRPGHLAK